MAEFMMLMKGAGKADLWASYINTLIDSGMFRGGSELANGSCVSKTDANGECSVSGFMRFEADNKEQVMALMPGNPVYESGGSIEVLEIVLSQ